MDELDLRELRSLEEIVVSNVRRRIVYLICKSARTTVLLTGTAGYYIRIELNKENVKPTRLVVNEKIFAVFQFLDAEKVQGLPQYLAELRVLLNGELRGYLPGVGILRSVNDDFFRRWDVRREQDRRVALFLPQDLL